MQEPIQSLEDVEDKRVEHIEASQLDPVTDAQDLKRQLQRIVFDTPSKEYSKEVATSFLNDSTPSILRRRFKLSSQHPPKNVISDPTKGTQTRFSLKNLCAFSAFFSLIELKDVNKAINEPV